MPPSQSRTPEQEWPEEFHPPAGSFAAATVTVAAVYTYFLGFAQFGFLHVLTAVLGETHPWLRPILAVMAAAGIAGGILVAKLDAERRGRLLIRTGFVGAALAAGLAWVARTPEIFLVAALLTGASLGVVTVTLVALLRREIGGRRLGGCLGAGTGVAYGICSLPAVFAGSPSVQLWLAIAAAGAGLVASETFVQRAPRQQIGGSDYEPAGVARWIAIFLLLVGCDSAVFSVIQRAAGLRAAWPHDGQLYVNATVHAVAALLAGLALDRRWIGGTVLAGALLLAGASLLFAGGHAGAPAAHLYSAGVSIYSVALVFYPARRGQPGLAALLYAVAGWTGSALGIGLAENLNQVPGWLPLGAVAAIAGLLSVRAWQK